MQVQFACYVQSKIIAIYITVSKILHTHCSEPELLCNLLGTHGSASLCRDDGQQDGGYNTMYSVALSRSRVIFPGGEFCTSKDT